MSGYAAGRRARHVALALVLLFLVPPCQASDGNDGAPDEHYGLRSVPVFRTEAEALATCGTDPVVWAERNAGFFYTKDENRYGKAARGAYACRMDALRANYWGTSLMDSILGYSGKSMKWEYPGS